MQSDRFDNTSDNDQNSTSCEHRRKRVNRMKAAIVFIVIIFMILPTICCIVLGLQVYRLQRQVEELASIHSQYGLSYGEKESEHYVYAAIKDEVETEMHDEHTSQPVEEDDAKKSSAGEGILSSTEALEDSLEDALKEEDLSLDTTASEKDVSAVSQEEALNLEEDTSNLTSDQAGSYSDKKVYLTFDDGPSKYTDDILDILLEYNVKATFFVVGQTDATSKKQYQRIVSEGHTLGMHSYSHKYSKIYNSIEDFDKDFTKLWKLLYDTTGYKPSIFRFPGGSDNLVNKNGMEDFIRYLNEASIIYFDWNVLNGDATGVEYTKEQLIDNVLNGVEIKDTSIVLMHDSQTKKTTVASLPGLLDILIAEGAQILPLNQDVSPIQMIKADTMK